MTALSQRTFSRPRMLDFLAGLEKAPPDYAVSLYLPPGLPPAEAENLIRDLAGQHDVPPELPGLASHSENGAVLFWSAEQKYLVLPPFPIAEKLSATGYATGQLRSLIERDYTIGLVLVRLGAYAIGVCGGEKLLSSKVGTGLVHGRHRKGGSSAHRFERHRDKQIEYFLTRVCQRAREHLEPHSRTLDYVVYGGARTTIQLLQKQCSFLERLTTPTLPPLLDIPDPRQAVLEKAVSRVWASTVMEWRQD